MDAQLIGIGTLLVWAFGFSYVFFKIQHAIMGLRVNAEDEIAGLDIPETGILAYPTFHTDTDDIGHHVSPTPALFAA